MIINSYRFGGGSTPIDPVAMSIYNKLVSWWEMNEASGPRNDSKGTNHVSPAGAVTTAAGVRGTDVAAEFASGGYMNAASNSTLQVPSGGGDHCWFGWAYVTANTGSQTFLSKWPATSSTAMEYMLDLSAGTTIRAINGSSSYYIASTSPPSAGAWHFYVAWRDSVDGKVRLQIDDGTVFVSAAASNPAPNTTPIYFGRTGGSTNTLTGRLQRWGWIKGGFLDPTERTYLYNSGSGRTWAELAAAAGH